MSEKRLIKEPEQICFINFPQPANANEKQTLRLRERAMMENGFDSFTDEEALETILSYAKGSDTREVVSRLYEAFGSLKGILEARPEQLMRVKGMNKSRAGIVSMAVPIARLWQRSAMDEQDTINNIAKAEQYCKCLLAGERLEKLYAIALSSRCKVLGKRCISIGSISEVNCYPRVVLETALNYNAHSMLLCHNHPGGSLEPSREDISSTKTIQTVLKGVGIIILDHIIVSGTNAYSMKSHSDITYT